MSPDYFCSEIRALTPLITKVARCLRPHAFCFFIFLMPLLRHLFYYFYAIIDAIICRHYSRHALLMICHIDAIIFHIIITYAIKFMPFIFHYEHDIMLPTTYYCHCFLPMLTYIIIIVFRAHYVTLRHASQILTLGWYYRCLFIVFPTSIDIYCLNTFVHLRKSAFRARAAKRLKRHAAASGTLLSA